MMYFWCLHIFTIPRFPIINCFVCFFQSMMMYAWWPYVFMVVSLCIFLCILALACRKRFMQKYGQARSEGIPGTTSDVGTTNQNTEQSECGISNLPVFTLPGTDTQNSGPHEFTGPVIYTMMPPPYSDKPPLYEDIYKDSANSQIEAGTSIQTGQIEAGTSQQTGQIEAGTFLQTGQSDDGISPQTGQIEAGTSPQTVSSITGQNEAEQSAAQTTSSTNVQSETEESSCQITSSTNDQTEAGESTQQTLSHMPGEYHEMSQCVTVYL